MSNGDYGVEIVITIGTVQSKLDELAKTWMETARSNYDNDEGILYDNLD